MSLDSCTESILLISAAKAREKLASACEKLASACKGLGVSALKGMGDMNGAPLAAVVR
jgi:hypothetical protein